MTKLYLDSNTTSAIHQFSTTGDLSPQLQDYFRNMNPSHALFNCPVMSYTTAYVLEYGALPDLKLRFPSTPRPMNIRSVNEKWPELISQLEPEKRGFVILKNKPEDFLIFIMQQLGSKTHAMVEGYWKINSTFGHIWNCVVVNNDDVMIVDSYSKKRFDQGLDNPKKFMSDYQTNSLSALIFFDATEKNKRLLSQYFNLQQDSAADSPETKAV